MGDQSPSNSLVIKSLISLCHSILIFSYIILKSGFIAYAIGILLLYQLI
jgi:hypothetical protein